MASYTFATTIPGPLATARERVVAALADEGFGVLTEIDVAATMKAKLGEEMPPYVILGACNPPLAHRAISNEASIGALLPCNVVLRQEGDEVIVDFMDPASVMGLVGSPEIAEVAREVRARLERVRTAVSG